MAARRMGQYFVLVVLAIAAVIAPPIAAQDLLSEAVGTAEDILSPVTRTMVSTLDLLEPTRLELTQSLVPPVPTCELATQIQPFDTCTAFLKTFNLDWDVLQALNPGLDCDTFTPWTSLCIGGVGASCNTAVDGSGQCPDLNNAEKTVPLQVGGITLTDALRAAFTSQPDLLALLQDSQTAASSIKVGGTESIVMVLKKISPTVKAVRHNPGHPFIGLWAATHPTTPLVITIIPGWFNDSGGLITYLPGAELTTFTGKGHKGKGRNLLSMRELMQGSGTYPGSAYYQGGNWYG